MQETVLAVVPLRGSIETPSVPTEGGDADREPESKPFTSLPDALTLAAIERAESHGTKDVWVVVIGDHLETAKQLGISPDQAHTLAR